jgi:hypothetical protein
MQLEKGGTKMPLTPQEAIYKLQAQQLAELRAFEEDPRQKIIVHAGFGLYAEDRVRYEAPQASDD